ncbi:MAG: hypothetical protein FJW37_08325, partial [Acidobacteria bacterium]|nr:hypothetical protein [Acidobacteriota bacterium]
ALDAATGRILWERTAHDGAVYDNRHRKNTYATPTPAADGRAIYAWFGSEGLYAYDFSGKLLWKSSLGPLAAMGMGVASSPALYRGLVILQCDQDNGEKSFLAAVRSQDGREAWRVKRTALEGWATPVVARGRERDELIVSARELVAAHDPASGKELWRSEGTGVNPAPSPVAGHGLVYLTAGAGEKKALAVRLGGAGEIAWRYNRGTAHVASPLVYGDYLYLMMDNGALSCLDARTGEVKYAGARLPAPASFSASMVAVDGRILLASEEGEVYLVRAGPKWELLGARSLGEGVYASPAIAGGRLFIRGERTLFCIGKRK